MAHATAGRRALLLIPCRAAAAPSLLQHPAGCHVSALHQIAPRCVALPRGSLAVLHPRCAGLRGLGWQLNPSHLPRKETSAAGVRTLTTASATSGRGGPDTSRQLKLVHILLPPGDEEQAKDLRKQILDGADMGQLAAQHSLCPSKSRNGLLGWIREGQMMPELDAPVFAARTGDLVMASSKHGWHLVRVEEEKVSAQVRSMAVEELAALLATVSVDPQSAREVQLVDVREPAEEDLASLPGFRLMPLSQFSSWGGKVVTELDPTKKTVVLCHHGVRSMQVSQFLVSMGFESVYNVSGGIDAYSRVVDSRVPLY